AARVAALFALGLAGGAVFPQAPAPAQDVPLPPPVEGGGTIRGTVTGPGGPLGGVRVQILGQSFGDLVLTRPDGVFELNVPKTGTYSYRVDDPGYRPTRGTTH